MQVIKYFCDICGKECLPQDGLGTFAGFLVKMNEKLEKKQVGFEGHYCDGCIEKLLDFINELKNVSNIPNNKE